MPEVQRLIENGVSSNAADYDGRTALVCKTNRDSQYDHKTYSDRAFIYEQHLASSQGHGEIVEFLLGKKADVTSRKFHFPNVLTENYCFASTRRPLAPV